MDNISKKRTSAGREFNPFRTGRTRLPWLALGLAILLHALFLFFLPEEVFKVGEGGEASERSFQFVFEPMPETEEIALQRFVEANPDVPENEPDETDQFSFRDQQAADESERPVTDEGPDTEGEEDSQKIVENILMPEIGPLSMDAIITAEAEAEMDAESAEVTDRIADAVGEGEASDGSGDVGESEESEERDASEEAVAEAAPAPRAPSDDFPFEDEEEAGEGSRLREGTERVENEVPSEGEVDGPIPITSTEDVTEVASAPSGGGEPRARPAPRPRPRVSPELVEAPIRRSSGAANRRGDVAIDATFNEFGEYQQQMMAAVQRGWFQEIDFFQPLDTAATVHIRFTLRSDGSVHDMQVVETSAGEVATLICQSAVEKRSPFRPWTRDMIEVFGEEQTMNFRFHYR